MELLLSKLWIIWASIGFILLIIEMFTPTMFLAGMGIGALLAGLANYFGLSLLWQIIIFSVFALIFTVYVRPIFKNSLLKPKPDELNIHSYNGQPAKVIEEINEQENTGRIKVFDEEWDAKSVDKQIIAKDEIVKIKHIKDMTAYVERQ